MTMAILATAILVMLVITNRVIPDLIRYIKIMRM